MGRRRISRASRSLGPEQREADTIDLVNSILHQQPADVVQLRKVVAVRGLVNHGLRARVWPLLLGIEGSPHDESDYEARHRGRHKDSQVVECDMTRSLWHLTEGWAEEEREAKRGALRRILNASVAGNTGDVYYYQGLHDIAAVLLFVCGERDAYRMLAYLTTCQLRDCTRPGLEAAVEMLALLYPILQQCDPALHAYLSSLDEPALASPYFALSWYMTWFAHDVQDRSSIERLFDLFLASHPLMPLYVAAVAMRGARESILACGDDGTAAYAALKGLRVLGGEGQPSADDLARQAAELYRQAPPGALLRRMPPASRPRHSTAVHAFLRQGYWRVPEQPRPGGAAFAEAVRQLRAVLAAGRQSFTSRPPAAAAASRQPRRRSAVLAVLSGATGLVAVGAALLISQAGGSPAALLLPWGQSPD